MAKKVSLAQFLTMTTPEKPVQIQSEVAKPKPVTNVWLQRKHQLDAKTKPSGQQVTPRNVLSKDLPVEQKKQLDEKCKQEEVKRKEQEDRDASWKAMQKREQERVEQERIELIKKRAVEYEEKRQKSILRKEKLEKAVKNGQVCPNFNKPDGCSHSEDYCLELGFFHPKTPCLHDVLYKLKTERLTCSLWNEEQQKKIARASGCRNSKCTYSHKYKYDSDYLEFDLSIAVDILIKKGQITRKIEEDSD